MSATGSFGDRQATLTRERVISLDSKEREDVRFFSFITSARDSDDMTLDTLPVSAEDVPPESVVVGLLTSTVSAPLLGGT